MAFSKTKVEENNLITISVLWVGEKKMELNIGLSEIHGEAIGDKEETLDSLEVPIILVLNQLALGLLQLILGLKILEIKLNRQLKI